jgi:uncharacterized protein YwgA
MLLLSYSSRCALVVKLAKDLRSRGSWCGETHLQKAMYILQDMSKSNFGYKYVIYKHGPYSFELNNELAAMRSANILEFQFPKEGYGPSIVATKFGEKVFSVNEENISAYEPVVEFLADWFATSDVRHLEKVATAYFLTVKNPRIPAAERAKKLNSLKPHVDIRAAEEAVRIVDEKRIEAKNQLKEIFA